MCLPLALSLMMCGDHREATSIERGSAAGYDPRIRRQPMLRSRSRLGGVLMRCGVLKLAKALSKLTAGVAAGRCAPATLMKVSSKSTAAMAALLPVECAVFGHSMVDATTMAFRTRTAVRTRVRLRDMGCLLALGDWSPLVGASRR